MAVKKEDQELDVIVEEEAIEEPEVDETEQSEEEVEVSEEDQEPEDEDDDEEDRIVTIGDSEPEEEDEEKAEAPGWVKKLRKVNRKQESEIKRLKRELEQRSSAQQQVPEIAEPGPEPTLKGSKYDEKKFKEALTEWHEKKRAYEEQKVQAQKAAEQQQQAWQAKQQRYVEKKEEHSFKDFTDAEEMVSNTLSIAQQGIIVQGAEDSALVVYALGKNPKKLEELAGTTDAVEFAFKVAKLESQLKVKSKKAPAPEKRVTSGKAGGLSGNTDKTLEALREKAAKIGDFTEVVAYKRKLREGKE
jgi:hypothetical protein